MALLTLHRRSPRVARQAAARHPLSSILYPLFSLALLATGCRKSDMANQPKFYHPYHETGMFADGTTARPLPEGTVARGHLQLEKDVFTGMQAGPDGQYNVPINYVPIKLTKDDLIRGQQKFDIYCAVCHGRVGDGAGMIATRGMIRPPSLVLTDHLPNDPAAKARVINLLRAPVGHYYQVITNGYGAMYSYNDRISVDDRWRIAAYIKALQLSQDADLNNTHVLFRPVVSAVPVPVQTDTNATVKDGPMPAH
jgi:mono/diheme cytochrome c family protein